jgi:hypothetical protein
MEIRDAERPRQPHWDDGYMAGSRRRQRADKVCSATIPSNAPIIVRCQQGMQKGKMAVCLDRLPGVPLAELAATALHQPRGNRCIWGSASRPPAAQLKTGKHNKQK